MPESEICVKPQPGELAVMAGAATNGKRVTFFEKDAKGYGDRGTLDLENIVSELFHEHVHVWENHAIGTSNNKPPSMTKYPDDVDVLRKSSNHYFDANTGYGDLYEKNPNEQHARALEPLGLKVGTDLQDWINQHTSR